MIELFSKRPEHLSSIETHLAPMHVDDTLYSLSAILLDDEYYSLLASGIDFIDGLPVLSIRYLTVFKMKAWLELTARRTEGKPVQSSDLAKHKNDVFRLVSTFAPDDYIESRERFVFRARQRRVNITVNITK